MSNRIDLTQFEGTIAEGKWHEHIHEPKEDGYERVASIVVSGVVAPPYTLQTNEGHTFATVEMGDLTAHLPLFMMVPDLIAELKRCYALIDKFQYVHGNSFENCFWRATCKPDGEGQCSLTIDSYEELIELVSTVKVEIPEYSHDHTELLLLEGCECGITHDEWLSSK
jgi:hypothetical protein